MLEKIYFDYTESDNQEDTFTPKHTRFDIVIEYNDKRYGTTYQCNTKYSFPNVEDFMDCFISDACSYENTNNIDDFANEYGYDKVSECIKAYEGCKESYNALHRLFTDDEIGQLIDELSDR